MEMACHLELPLLGNEAKVIKTQTQTGICSPKFIVAKNILSLTVR